MPQWSCILSNRVFEVVNAICFCLIVVLMIVLISARNKITELSLENQRLENCLEVVRQDKEKLSDKLENIEVFESHWQEVEDYIKWKDKMVLNATKPIPELERTKEEMERDKLKVWAIALNSGKCGR